MAARGAGAAGAKQPTIGFLGGRHAFKPEPMGYRLCARAAGTGLDRWAQCAIEYRWGEGRVERYAEIAAEFVRLDVDVILAGGTEVAIAAKQATSAIPIVFSVAGDPVGAGFVATWPGRAATSPACQISNRSRCQAS